jgi:hypothetical protein
MNGAEFSVRVPEVFIENESIIEVILVSSHPYPVICRKLFEKEVESIGVVHKKFQVLYS